uniref:Putative secreted protein n=1 Tax=Anopheles darlingi TaxID=43151 RepID=A0A2M4DGR2_ANODA
MMMMMMMVCRFVCLCDGDGDDDDGAYVDSIDSPQHTPFFRSKELRSIHTPSGCTNLSFHFGNYLTPAPSLRVGRFSTDRPLQADCCRPSF